MISPRYARLTARLLAQQSPPDFEPSQQSRAETLEIIALALSAKTQRRIRRARFSAASVASAAVLLGYFGVQRLLHPTRVADPQAVSAVSAVAESSGSGAAILGPAGMRGLLSPMELQQGGRLLAGANGGATVQLSTGTRLEVEHDTNLDFESAGPVQRFFLAQGALQAKVAKLATGQRFIVRTTDAEVEVRGTSFRVSIVAPSAACGAGTLTRVSVDEGIVEVRRAAASTYVHPGENWPEHCAAPLPAAIVTPQSGSPAEQVPKRVASASGAASERASMTPHSLAPAVSSSVEVSTVARHSEKETSSVAQQNELFSKAVAASRLGDTRGALSSFELFVARYPTSPLAESATVHRLRLLRGIDLVAAQTAARAYLSRYPGGYAKNDAEKLLSQP